MMNVVQYVRITLIGRLQGREFDGVLLFNVEISHSKNLHTFLSYFRLYTVRKKTIHCEFYKYIYSKHKKRSRNKLYTYPILDIKIQQQHQVGVSVLTGLLPPEPYGINFEPIKMNVTFQETNENIN